MTMHYEGHVEPDGPPIERVDGPVLLRKRSVEQMDNNVYVIGCTSTRACLVVDAAARADLIVEMVGELQPVAIVQTHGHWDHVRAWDELSSALDCPVWAHRGDEDLFPREADRWLQGSERLEVGDLGIKVLHTPGHTDGAIQFLVTGAERSHLMSGDSLFPGGPGNTWGDAEKFTLLMDGLEEQVFGPLPDDTWLYPGHGDDSTLGWERPHLAEWRARGW